MSRPPIIANVLVSGPETRQVEYGSEFIVHDDDFSAPEKMATEIAASGRMCVILWYRPEDGQVAYWGPKGASLSPVYFGESCRTGRKPLADGEGSVTTSIRLTPNQREKLSSLGGGKWVRLQIDSA